MPKFVFIFDDLRQFAVEDLLRKQSKIFPASSQAVFFVSASPCKFSKYYSYISSMCVNFGAL